MKKGIILFVAVLMMSSLALFGCSSNNNSSSSKSSSSSSSSSSSEEKPTLVKEGVLTVATSPDYPPFENLVDGQYVGIDIEIARAVGAKLGLQVEFKNIQFDGIIPAIAAGGQADIGASGFSVDPERAKEIDFTETYYIDDQAIAVMNSSTVTAENYGEALNKDTITIGVQSGTTGEAYIRENFPLARVQALNSSTDIFAAMQSGQVQACCSNLAVVTRMIRDAYPDARIVRSIATGEEYAMICNKSNTALTKQVDKALKELTNDGTIDAIVKRFM